MWHFRPAHQIVQLLRSRCPGNAPNKRFFKGNGAIATGHPPFPRVPWVMVRVPATRIDELRPLRIGTKHRKEQWPW